MPASSHRWERRSAQVADRLSYATNASMPSSSSPWYGAISETIESVESGLRAQRYIAGRELATTIFLALSLSKPILLEGEAGVGKTEVGKVLAAMLDTRLIRLQCYEGIDVSTAVYEWNYTRQMLHIRLMEAGGINRQEELKEIFGPDFLMQRPLLQAIDPA